MKMWRALLAVVMLIVLAACGGGGGGAGCSVFDTDCDGTSGGGGGTTTPAATGVLVQFEPGVITNSGSETAVARITVVGEGSQALAGVPVRLSLVDSENASSWATTNNRDATTGLPVTDDSGVISAEVSVTKDSALRSITLQAAAGNVAGSSRLNVDASTTLARDLLLTLSAAQIPNSTAAAVTATATAVDGNRRALAGIPITLSVDNGGTILQSSATSSTAGTVTGTVRIGADRTNRTIQVTAVSGSVTRVVSLEVTGATLSASPLKSRLNFGEASSITYKLVDSTGAAMARQAISVEQAGVVVADNETDAQGEFVYRFNAPASGADFKVLARAAGTLAESPIELTSADVEPAKLAVVSGSVSANPSVVSVNQPGAQTINKVEVRALFLGDNNEPVQNVRAWFDLDGDPNSVGGTLESTANGKFLYSDVNGIVRTNYVPGSRFSPKDGVSIRVCYDENDFALPPKDAEGKFIDGAICSTIVGGFATGVQTKTARTRLTVISESLSVSIGTDSRLSDGASGVTYVQRFAVQVVDSAGRAKSGVAIAPSIDLTHFYQGFWVNDQGVVWRRAGLGNRYPTNYPGSGAPVPTALQLADTVIPDSVTDPLQRRALQVDRVTVCENEDLNRNGAAEDFLDQLERSIVPEDQNNSAASGRPALDPRKADVTIATVGSDTTNADGIVILRIEYPKNLASWVGYRILVSASGVAGTEGRAVYDAILATLAADISNLQVSPPFQLSPYGTGARNRTFPRQLAGGPVTYLCRDDATVP